MPLTWLLSMWASQIRAQNPKSIRQLRIKPLLQAASEGWKEPFFRQTPSQMQWLWELQSGNSTPGEQLAAKTSLFILTSTLSLPTPQRVPDHLQQNSQESFLNLDQLPGGEGAGICMLKGLPDQP